jgi:hypothetical protein
MFTDFEELHYTLWVKSIYPAREFDLCTSPCELTVLLQNYCNHFPRQIILEEKIGVEHRLEQLIGK